jgi:hypothetical protein
MQSVEVANKIATRSALRSASQGITPLSLPRLVAPIVRPRTRTPPFAREVTFILADSLQKPLIHKLS